jgi:hypothetical protein
MIGTGFNRYGKLAVAINVRQWYGVAVTKMLDDFEVSPNERNLFGLRRQSVAATALSDDPRRSLVSTRP